MRYRIRRHPASAPFLSPPHLIAHRPTASRPASRPASRRTVSPHGSARSTTLSYTLHASPRLLTRLVHLIGSSINPIACSVPTHAAAHHLIHLIGSSTTPHPMRRATSKTERRTGRAIDNRKVERHDIRYLPDNANATPRPPYSPYKP